MKTMDALPHPIQAVCFDLDGTLLDSEIFYFETMRDWLQQHFGIVITREEYVHYDLTLDDMLIPHLIECGSLPKDAVVADINIAIMAEAERTFDRLVQAKSSRQSAESLWAFHRAHPTLPLSLVSCSKHPYVDPYVEAYNLEELFTLVLTGDDVARLKPDPEIYDLAARRLGTAPSHMIAVEDAPRGIAAALASGMTVLRNLDFLLIHETLAKTHECATLQDALAYIEKGLA